MSRALIVLAIALFATHAVAQTVVVRSGAREVDVAIGALPSEEIAIRDPTDGGKPKQLVGARLTRVLARLPRPPDSDAVAVRCQDGWLSLIPLTVAERFPEALLAVAEVGASRRISLAAPRGPVFLVWPNVARPDVAGDRDLAENGFAWGVAALEYVRLVDFQRPLSPTANALPVAQRGRALFQHYCQHCHAIRGAGGVAGWDLAEPSLFTYRSESYVRGYILDPRRQNPSGHMSSFKSKLAPSELDELIAYLRAL